MIMLEQIRQRITETIKQSELTQTELARRLGVGQQTISEYIRGKSMPALDTFANLCAILDVDANDILCINEYKPN
ncbi:MAG: helix-turn-helix transcriptional regulator [Clostridia bacterium]|nr:helix-turn-helix transcriptional regulator [Clostridia bacterium]